MRFIGSLIKYVIYLCVILIAVSAALFWFDTGDWLALPLAKRAGNYFLAPMTVNIDNISGSLRRGYTIEGLTLSSGDNDLFTLDYASVSPDWDLVLAGVNGLPFIRNLNVRGVSSDLDKVMIIAKHFESQEDNESQENEEESNQDEAASFRVNPFSLSVSDVNFGTPYANLSLDAITLNPNGNFALAANITSRDNTLPLKTNALLNFDPLEVISSDLFIGQKGTGKFSGGLDPLKGYISLTALSLEEFMKFAPDFGIKASGRIDGRVSAVSEDGTLKASGVVSMPRADVMGVPLNFRLPFSWDGAGLLVLDNATLNTKAASVKLNAETDTEALTLKAQGEAQNISLNEIGRMFAPEAGLDGEGGNLKFDVDAVLTGDILGKSRADITASMPQITAAGIRILRDLSAHVKLEPGFAPRISMNGEVFKGKLFARGEATQDSLGNIKPKAVVSIVNLDVPTVINTLLDPKLAKSLQNPSGKITARAEIFDTLDIDGRITSDRLSAYGVTLTNILAEGSYLHSKSRAEIEGLSLNLGKGKITASGSANLKDERFSFRADAENIEPRVIPQLKDIKGTYNLTAQGSGKYTDQNSIKVEADISAKNAGYADFTVNSVKIPVDFANNTAAIRNAIVNLPKGSVNLNGSANLTTSMFDIKANAQNIDPSFIVKDLAGTYNLTAEASGKFTDINAISAKADLTARNVGYSGMAIGNMNLPVSFANSTLKINGARANLPGGALSLTGSVGLKNTANPVLDLSASTQGVNLAETFRKLKLDVPVSGKVWGVVSIKGPLDRAGVNAAFKAENVKAADIASIPSAELKVQGNTQSVNVTKLEATVNETLIRGNGSIKINQKDIMRSNVNVQAKVSRLNLKRVLSQFMETPPVSGIIRGDIALRGSLAEPALDVKLNSPVIYGSTEIHDIAVRLRSPEANHYAVNAKARIDEFCPEADVDLRNNKGIWAYHVKTKPLDVDKAIQAQMPEMAGIVKGVVNLDVRGSTKPNSDININVNSPNIRVIDKLDIEDISLPTAYRPSVNKVELKKARAIISDGVINSGFEYDISKSTWKGNVKAVHLDFGKLATKFLPEGELVGSVDAEVSMKGQQGIMSTSFANGKFSTTPGYLHKMAMLDKITPTKRVSFENINGTFFWNGSDLFLNPGTGAKAGADEPLYRYVSVNGSLGLPGKGLRLLCDGRFDLKILDQFLGAMKGVFQYMAGGLGRNVLKDAAGRVIGLKRRDFQNVSFTLANSWDKLRFEDLKITKPIEDFLPIDILNWDEEKQKDDTQFNLRLRIPTGRGHKSVEEESTSDQFKEQLIDNLFNLGL
ncbi:MAG: hypothetical protein IJR85_04435 [Synergistaceae bacterium]|nr:hypothetical protein [Synergistaceae bacterium]